MGSATYWTVYFVVLSVSWIVVVWISLKNRQTAVLNLIKTGIDITILQCAKSDDLHQRHNDSIVICTDSQAALRALSCPKVTSALVLQTMAALRELAIFNS